MTNPASGASVGNAWFCAGTKVMTLRGEVPIELTHDGDRALTLSGNGSALKPVAALLRLDVDLDLHPQPANAAPVRVRADAIEPGMPIRDLLLSPGTCLGLEGEDGTRVLVPVLMLVNGATILREPASGQVSYFQLALEAHDILMANGMAAEAAVATSPAEGIIVRLHDRAPKELPPADLMPAARDAACVPVLLGAAALPLHARLLAAAEAAGHALTDDPDLLLSIDGVDLAPLSQSGGEYIFLLPPGASALRLRSRSSAPCETNPAGGDARRLGVALVRLVHDGADIPLDGPACVSGFLPREQDGSNAWRWTNGDANLSLAPGQFETTLKLRLQPGWARYWIAPA